jgi:ubiquinone/menaquinone biosynthesis C-methylase UbiE
MSSGSFGWGYRSIDDAEAPDSLLSYLDRIAEVPAIAAAKRRLTEALEPAPGRRILDVGCGTGVDLAGMAEAVRPGGRIVGADVSALAVAEAQRRFADADDIEVLVADAHDLPFRDETFDGIRADRTMLHLAEPERALGEFRRVLMPGGRVAILETGTRLDGDPAVVGTAAHRTVAGRYWRPSEDVAQINLFLPLLLARAGFAQVHAERAAATSGDFADADRMLRLRSGAEEAAAAGELSSEEAVRWLTPRGPACNRGRSASHGRASTSSP